jgi:predicted glycosyltransferase
MKVWIDLSNSPHPLLFAPVVRRLRDDGHEVVLTARDNAQTVELTLERWPEAEVIGGEAPKQKAAKARAIARRMYDLRRWAASARPDVALSHNSYAQIVAARSLRLPAVTAMDYEHQPANHLAFRLATTIVLPEVLPLSVLRSQGATPRKVVTYPGLKEELYIGDFEPDPGVLAGLGLDDQDTNGGTAEPILVVARTPPSRAVYHSFDNPLFERALQAVCAQENVVCVALTRHAEQITAIDALGLDNCIVPRIAIDSRSLMYRADAMIGAGGTMTREAALMGIPTWSLFAGNPPAVDLWLERQGRLSRLASPEQLGRLVPRSAQPHETAQLRSRGRAIEEVLVGATVAAANGAGRP